ncbi:MAG: hypothetical protein HOB63_03775, partial [Opitutae bacterium]|nr:hypothetical protein [Opitutae bacterium]
MLFLTFAKRFLVAAVAFSFMQSGLRAESLEMWISSHQDQVYYEKMAELYRKKTK